MKAILLLAIITFAIIGCDSEPSITSSGIPPGDLTGSVILRDTLNQTTYKSDGVIISLEGTSYKATSDSTGQYRLQNIPVGTYVLVLEKQGFGTKKLFNIQHTANGTLYLPIQTLRQLPRISPDLVLRGFDGDKALFTAFISSGIQQYANLRSLRIGLFCSKNNTPIDPLVPNTYDATFSSSIYLTDTISYSIGVYRSTLLNYGYKPGDNVYAVAAAVLQDDYQDYGYYDYSLKKLISTGIGLNYSPMYSFILP